METTWDKLRAVVFALGLHALVVGLLFVGLLTHPVPASADAEGPVIEATLVSSPQQSAAIAKAIKALDQKTAQDTPPPLPKPEPKPVEAPPQQLAPQAQLPKPDTVDQEEVRRDADLAALRKQREEQEERRKQSQIDQTNKEKQQREAQEIERIKQEAHQKLLAATRDRMLKEQRLKQTEDLAAKLGLNNPPPATVPGTHPHPPAGNNGEDNSLLVKYKKAIRDVVQQNWHTANVPENVHCNVQIKQLPGGEVLDVIFLAGCAFDAPARASVEDALKRTPLPYAGYESVFNRQVTMDMCYPEEVCTR